MGSGARINGGGRIYCKGGMVQVQELITGFMAEDTD